LKRGVTVLTGAVALALALERYNAGVSRTLKSVRRWATRTHQMVAKCAGRVHTVYARVANAHARAEAWLQPSPPGWRTKVAPGCSLWKVRICLLCFG
jgi:hypothetical protein